MTDTYLAPAPAPRQLDIIADTALRKTPGVLSTAPSIQTPGVLSTARKNETPGALSTATIKDIEKRRLKAGISIPRLCTAAGIHPRSYEVARAGKGGVRKTTLRKLSDALDRHGERVEPEERRTLCQSYVRKVTRDLARQSGWDPELMLNQDFSSENTNDPVWLQASRLRRCAIYLVVEGLFSGKRAPVARAIGISRQAVHKGVAAIEAERMRNSEFDKKMELALLELRADR
ncbi:hypothetical protein [Bradyrhizobium sp. 76]|uniref:hypothetical protein n=1 Tax=Bradyrhizobium sp. 76 TaxID=2782680 RepID=UPI001FF86177|nr:hypothetical protein [Bradyrhizobium sp. 76]MCK1407640.1 hypothetical protein [Bradyrhizobium sp. 76]